MSASAGPTPGWRAAAPGEAAALRDLERAANLEALAHVFPADRHPFPDAEVLRHWEATLADRAVRVEVCADPSGLLAYVAYDATLLRHLAVRPDAWGRGLARAGVERAVLSIGAAGESTAGLWCLAENTRARGLYRHLGWVETGRERPARWPPYPRELLLERPITGLENSSLWRPGPG